MDLLEKIKSKTPISDEELNIEHIWHIRDVHGETLLHWAAVNNDVQLVRKLIELGVPPNTPNYRGTAPLYYAASKDSKEVCVELLQYVDARFRSGFSGCTSDDATHDKELAGILFDARLAIESAIEDKAKLHLYRMCRWGFDTQTYKIHCDAEHNTTMLEYCKSQWPDPYLLRPDLENLSTLDIHKKVLHDWALFLQVIKKDMATNKFCSGCGNVNIPLKRCAKCKKLYFCGETCLKNSKLIHKTLLKC